MSDMNSNPAPQSQIDKWIEPGPANVQAIYILYLLGLVTGITPLVGLVLAYVNRGKAEEWIETHYTWAIRTFWISLVYTFLSFLLVFVLVGIVTAIATSVWFIVRCVIGLQAVGKNEPIKNPESWLI